MLLSIYKVKQSVADTFSWHIHCRSTEMVNAPAHAKAPLAPSLHARNGSQVIALLGAEVKELLGDFGCDSMVAVVWGGHFAVAIAQEAGHGLGGMESQRLFEDVQALRHGERVVGVVERLLGVVLRGEGDCDEAEECY
jgi:hypothetical protein